MIEKVYKIERIGDFLKIPSDRIQACFNELSENLRVVKANLELLGINPTGEEVKTFTWKDDNRKDVTITARISDSDDVYSVKISKEAEGG